MIVHQAPKVLLTTLTERTSAKGKAYLAGWGALAVLAIDEMGEA